MPIKKSKENKLMPRTFARIRPDQLAFIKAEAKKSKGEFSEADVQRQLLDEAISNRKKK